jgi:group I intron endonuclease
MILYLIRNVVNNKVYVGQTREKVEGQRKRQHFHRLKAGTHQNPYLQAAYNKYGAENFQFELIEVCDSLEELNNLEEIWIEFYQNNGQCYNLRAGGKVNAVSEQTKSRMRIAQNDPKLLEIRSKTHKGKAKSKDHIQKLRISNIRTKTKKVAKYSSIDDSLLTIFDSIPEAWQDYGKSKSGFESHLYRNSKGKLVYYRLYK